jgi:RNA polymerase sigma-70 factor (ECF subfamily)
MNDDSKIKLLLKNISEYNDQSAYRELFICLHKPLYEFAYGILKSRDVAEEVVSDLFITIWQKREGLSSIHSPLHYFYTSVKNLSLNSIAKERRRQARDAGEWLVPLNSVYFEPEKLLITAEILQQIRNAVQDLPTRCRLIFKLIKDDGLKYQEVADLLEISVKTVEAQMAIALRRLGKCMQLELPQVREKGQKK